MTSVFAASRWQHEDGRAWRYSGPAQVSMADAPVEVREASKTGWVTDTLIGEMFRTERDGSITVKEG